MGTLHPVHRITELGLQVKGEVIAPDDAGYDAARRAWNLMIDQRPAVILVAEQAEDIMAGVRFASEARLGVGVQSTGHGHKSPADDGLLIVTSKMNAVEVDPAARTARIEAGARWHHVLDVVAPHGLAPLLGSAPHVGVVGYALGGGIGWLARRYGLAADSVRAVEIVTADGALRRASAEEHADLFWGLRGGGAGSFGVVTAVELDLFPVSSIYGGFLVYPGELAGEALHRFRDWVKDAPDELTSSIAIAKFPNAPFVPEPIRGKIQVIVRAAFAGDEAPGAALIQPWLDWRAPLRNTFRQMPFAEIGEVSQDPVDPSAGYAVSELFETLSDAAIDVIVRRATSPESPVVLNDLRHAGGAISRVEPDANAVGNRDAQFYLTMGGPVPTPEALERMKAYLPLYQADLKPYISGGAYLNLAIGPEALARVRDGFRPETFRRLAELKASCDPDNLFRFNLPYSAG